MRLTKEITECLRRNPLEMVDALLGAALDSDDAELTLDVLTWFAEHHASPFAFGTRQTNEKISPIIEKSFRAAVEYNSPAMIEVFLTADFDFLPAPDHLATLIFKPPERLNRIDRQADRTMVSLAAGQGDVPLLELLLTHGGREAVHPDAQQEQVWSLNSRRELEPVLPWMCAISETSSRDTIPVLTTLMDAGGWEPQISGTHGGFPPLVYALLKQREDVACFLLDQGCDPTLTAPFPEFRGELSEDGLKVSAIALAVLAGYDDLAERIVERMGGLHDWDLWERGRPPEDFHGLDWDEEVLANGKRTLERIALKVQARMGGTDEARKTPSL